MDDVTKRGLAVFGELMSEDAASSIREVMEADGIGSDLAKLALDVAFGTFWSRDGLERKQRSLVVIGMLIALRQTSELQNHIRIGLNNGLTPREIEEAVTTAVPYAGFPAVAQAMTALVTVFRERGIEVVKTAKERGTLS